MQNIFHRSNNSWKCFLPQISPEIARYAFFNEIQTVLNFHCPSVEAGVMATMIMHASIAPRAFTIFFHLASSFRIKNSSSRTHFQPPNAEEKWILFSIFFHFILEENKWKDCCAPLNWDYQHTTASCVAEKKRRWEWKSIFFFNSSIFRWFPSDARSQLHQKSHFLLSALIKLSEKKAWDVEEKMKA